MAVLLGRAPTCLVEKHVEDVSLLFCVDRVQLLIQVTKLKEALRHEVILDALVLKIAVHRLDKL